MAVSLRKGDNVSLSKEVPGLNKISVALGWDVQGDETFDLDASAFLLNKSGKVRSSADFVFYNQLSTRDGSVVHTGDNLTGEGDEGADDELIHVTLSDVSPEVQTITFTVTIHHAQKRGQNFGQVTRAFIRIINRDNNEQISIFELSEEASKSTAMIFGSLYRDGNEWKFNAVGQGVEGGLEALAKQYGVGVKST